MNKQKIENRCAVDLASWYEVQGVECSWQQEKCDPPDFWFVLDGIRYATEVTSIHGFNDDGQDWRKNAKAMDEYINAILKAVNERVCLTKLYCLTFNPQSSIRAALPLVIEALVEHLNKVESGVLSVNEYVSPENTSRITFANIKVSQIEDDQSGLMYIAHEFSKRPHMGEGGQGPSALRKIIVAKAEKMKKIVEPKILIVENHYWIADVSEYPRSALPPEAEMFESIFTIKHSSRLVELLHNSLLDH